MVHIPLVDLKAQHELIRDELLAAMTRCLDKGQFILGEEVEAFEAEMADFLDVPHAVGVSSGTDALLVIAMALDIGPGDEVLTTPFSFFATAGVIARLGAKPVFADIEEATFNLDPVEVEARLTDRMKAVIPVHLYGRLADMPAIAETAERRGVPIIEDAAQAIGARSADGKQIGAFGVATALSFYPSKNLAALGEAGMVLTRDEAFAASIRSLRTHGGTREYYHDRVGGNFRMDALQAAALRVKLKHLPGWNARRANLARRYDALLRESGLVEAGHVTPLAPTTGSEHVHHQYVVRVGGGRRDGLREHLGRAGIATGVYYPLPLHLQPCFRALGYGQGDFPVAERAALEGLALPMFPQLEASQQEAVVDAAMKFFRK